MQMWDITSYHSNIPFLIIPDTLSYKLLATSMSKQHNLIFGMFMSWQYELRVYDTAT